MADCSACQSRGKTWEGGEPVCSFSSGVFSSEGWNCATANAIRTHVPRWAEGSVHRLANVRLCEGMDDQNFAIIDISGVELPSGHALTLWISWYKGRGRTEAMWLLSEQDDPRLPTEADCVAIAAFLDMEATAEPTQPDVGLRLSASSGPIMAGKVTIYGARDPE